MTYRTIPLSMGLCAIIDEEDFDRVSRFKWYANTDYPGYTRVRRSVTINGKRKSVSLSSFIMNPPDNMIVDHINGNGLDNRRKNLRICSHADNIRNQSVKKSNKTGYKGVHKNGSRYRAEIYHNGKNRSLGYFNTPEEAAKAYDSAAIMIHGEFARLNFSD